MFQLELLVLQNVSPLKTTHVLFDKNQTETRPNRYIKELVRKTHTYIPPKMSTTSIFKRIYILPMFQGSEGHHQSFKSHLIYLSSCFHF